MTRESATHPKTASEASLLHLVLVRMFRLAIRNILWRWLS
ncbi:hypothetical protein FHS02_002505 [Massilia umbonata]|uniref:Uncharacterized protein n=1 Tax=Pseudoduganella umbonata TaxID=864828 RepID=A0A7W5HAS3_9BURK|nr:hypothetical protein [Pseudoduganella umbonata]